MMLARSIIEKISKVLRDAQRDTGIKLDANKSSTIILIDQGILEDSEELVEVCGMRVFSCGYIGHECDAMLAFPTEMTSKEFKLNRVFQEYLNTDRIS